MISRLAPTLRKSLPNHFMTSFSTYDKSEVQKFSKVGSEWWNPRSSQGTGPLHSMNPVRVDFIRTILSKHRGTEDIAPMISLRGLRILDVGCGAGLLSEALSRLGAQVTAIDPSSANINIAKLHSSKDILTKDIEYKNCTIEDVVQSGVTFDAVCSLEVVEHVPSPRSFIKSCASCVKEEGHLFLSTINRTIKSNLIAIVGAEYITGIVPRGTHDWNKFLSPSELESYLNSSKFCTREIRGLVPSDILLPFKLLNNSGDLHWRLSESDLDVNYILHATMRG